MRQQTLVKEGTLTTEVGQHIGLAQGRVTLFPRRWVKSSRTSMTIIVVDGSRRFYPALVTPTENHHHHFSLRQ